MHLLHINCFKLVLFNLQHFFKQSSICMLCLQSTEKFTMINCQDFARFLNIHLKTNKNVQYFTIITKLVVKNESN